MNNIKKNKVKLMNYRKIRIFIFKIQNSIINKYQVIEDKHEILEEKKSENKNILIKDNIKNSNNINEIDIKNLPKSIKFIDKEKKSNYINKSKTLIHAKNTNKNTVTSIYLTKTNIIYYRFSKN